MSGPARTRFEAARRRLREARQAHAEAVMRLGEAIDNFERAGHDLGVSLDQLEDVVAFRARISDDRRSS